MLDILIKQLHKLAFKQLRDRNIDYVRIKKRIKNLKYIFQGVDLTIYDQKFVKSTKIMCLFKGCFVDVALIFALFRIPYFY